MKYEIVREGGVKKRNGLYGCNLNLEKNNEQGFRSRAVF